jgi:EmrB/QacA subfamily drug resistance transporter
MSDAVPVTPAGAPATAMPDPRRWFALVVIAIAQLMVVLDASIVNIALPSAAKALDIAPQDYQWAVTAYTITFGGFLLLGGRIADFIGRKRAFMIGLVGFAAASLLGGFSVNQQMLFGARAIQGLFGALLAPAALSLISVTFTVSTERAKAFAVYGALSGVGAAIGLIFGGFLVEYINWRWCFFVNTPMALIALFLAIPNVRESKVEGHPRYDVPGALLATGGMVLIVFGVTQASTHGWGSIATWPYLLIGAVLLIFFLMLERVSSHPLLPLHLITDRVRAGTYTTQLLVGLGIFGMFLFMTFYFQNILDYSAVKAGLSFLPFSIGVIISATIASRILPKVGPRPIASIGLTVSATGLFILSHLKVDTPYWTRIVPAMLMMSLGLGMTFVCLASTALFHVPSRETGAASAVLNTTQQVGGSFGTAIQNTLWVSAATAFLATAHGISLHKCQILLSQHLPAPEVCSTAAVHGYDVAFRFGSLMMLLGAITFFVVVNIDRHHLGQHDGAVEMV